MKPVTHVCRSNTPVLKWTETQEQIGHTAAALDRLAAQIATATAKLKE